MTNSKTRKLARTAATAASLRQKDVRIAELEAQLKQSAFTPSSTDQSREPKIAALEAEVKNLKIQLRNSEKSRIEVTECLQRIKSTIVRNFGKKAVGRFTKDTLTNTIKKQYEIGIRQNPEGLPGSAEGFQGRVASEPASEDEPDCSTLTTEDSITSYAMQWQSNFKDDTTFHQDEEHEEAPKATSTPKCQQQSFHLPKITSIREISTPDENPDSLTGARAVDYPDHQDLDR